MIMFKNNYFSLLKFNSNENVTQFILYYSLGIFSFLEVIDNI